MWSYKNATELKFVSSWWMTLFLMLLQLFRSERIRMTMRRVRWTLCSTSVIWTRSQACLMMYHSKISFGSLMMCPTNRWRSSGFLAALEEIYGVLFMSDKKVSESLKQEWTEIFTNIVTQKQLEASISNGIFPKPWISFCAQKLPCSCSWPRKKHHILNSAKI